MEINARNLFASSTRPVLDLLANHENTLRKIVFSNLRLELPTIASHASKAEDMIGTWSSFLREIISRQELHEEPRIGFINLQHLGWMHAQSDHADTFSIFLSSGHGSQQWPDAPGGGIYRGVRDYDIEAKGSTAVLLALKVAANHLERDCNLGRRLKKQRDQIVAC